MIPFLFVHLSVYPHLSLLFFCGIISVIKKPNILYILDMKIHRVRLTSPVCDKIFRALATPLPEHVSCICGCIVGDVEL